MILNCLNRIYNANAALIGTYFKMNSLRKFNFQPFRRKTTQHPNNREIMTKSNSKLLVFDKENKENKETVGTGCQENFNEYLLNTTLHGLRYVGDRTLTLFERLFFGLMFASVFILAVIFISNVWMKWSASPIIITLGASSTSITTIPFPAVTICNMNQAQKSAVRFLPYDSVDYSMIQSLCGVLDENATNSQSGKWPQFERLLMKVSQPCKDMLVWCNYGGFERKCMDIFTSVLTDEGLCCIFNGLSKKFTMRDEYGKQEELNTSETLKYEENDWSPERGYKLKDLRMNKNRSPRPAAGTGHNMGLTLMLNVAESEYYCSSTNSYGFKVLLHSPNELPKIAYYGTAVANGFETRIVIVPTLSAASNAVRAVSRKIRKCLFENENYLTFFRTYSRRNCQTECETKIFLKHCKCIMYYMPRFSEDITICGRSDNVCVNDVKHAVRSRANSSFICECLPGCFGVNFDTELSLSPLLSRSPLLQSKALTARNTAIVHIYYKDYSFRNQNKDEIIGFTDFLSNTGGLLGLFMGFSVISLAELFYFMTIRPLCNYLRRSGKHPGFKILFNKVRNMKLGRTSNITSKASTIKTIENIHFPYID